MLEKGQIKVRTDFAFEKKDLPAVTLAAGYAIQALLIAAVLIGSTILCTAYSFAWTMYRQ